MRTFEVTISDERYPDLVLIIHRPGARPIVERSSYDVAFTKFEVHLKNALQSILQEILRRRKGI
ncbi:hypothetical protein LCGC14_2895260 [marine sediment metagenome]|uniref:Uncharacterized protein n=1 Tax=marine sediment metagenome TaxID=412755 RepID=A0A0F8YHT2_9ZZZZ